MSYLDNIVFAIVLIVGFGYFILNIKKIYRNINLGIDVDRKDNSAMRWRNMALVALGQKNVYQTNTCFVAFYIVCSIHNYSN